MIKIFFRLIFLTKKPPHQSNDENKIGRLKSESEMPVDFQQHIDQNRSEK